MNTINDILLLFNNKFYKLCVFKTTKKDFIKIDHGIITIYYTKNFNISETFLNSIVNSNIAQIETDCFDLTELLLNNYDFKLKCKSNLSTKSKNIFYRFFQFIFPSLQYNYTLYYLNRKVLVAHIKLF